MSTGTKIGIVFALGVVVLLVLGGSAYVSTQRLIEANRWVTHTHEVLEHLEDIPSAVTDAETGERGFLLTGDERYLEPYRTASSRLQHDVEMVVTLTADNPEQQASIQLVRKLSDAELVELGETIKLRRKSGLEAALAVVRTDRGKKLMDELRGVVAQMEAREQQLLETRNAAADASARHALWTITVWVPLALGVLAIAAVILIRTVRFGGLVVPSGAAGRNWAGIAVRYVFAVVAVAVAVVLRWRLEASFGPLPVFITLYPAVLLVASIAGGGPGLLTTLLSSLAATYWFIPPIGQFNIEAPNDVLAVGIFTGANLFLCLLAERLRRARWAEAVGAAQEEELALLDMGNLLSLAPDHRITHWSEGCRRLYGFSSEEAQGRFTHELLETRASQPPREELQRALLTSGHWEGEVVRRRKDGEEMVVTLLWALRRDDLGQPSAILEVSTDVTEQRRAEEAVRQQSEELLRQNEELTQQSEELSQQSEELTQQNEELQAQSEELQSQSEEIQALNAELTRREEMLQKLLDSARLAAAEQAVMREICAAALEMFGEAASVVIVCEKEAEGLRIHAAAGLKEGSAAPEWLSPERSFAALAIQQNRTACLHDTSLRPDLSILQIPGEPPFHAVLAAPMRDGGQASGAVAIFSRQPHQWTAEQFRLAEWLAGQCARILETLRLQDDLRRQAALIDLSPDGIIVRRLDGTITLWSHGAEILYGWTKDEAIGQTTHALLKTQFPQPLEQINQQLRETGRWSGKLVHATKDGGQVIVESRWLAQRDAQGEIVELLESNVDLTERKQAEERLLKFFSIAPDLLCIAGFDGYFKELSRSWETTLGYNLQELLAKPWLEFVHPEDQEATIAAGKQLVEGHQLIKFQNRYRTEDGRYRWIEWHCAPLMEQSLIYCGARDVTERKLFEEALRRSEEQLRVAALAAEIGVWSWTPGTSNVVVSANWRRLFGVAPEVEVTLETWREALHPEDRDRAVRELSEASEQHRDFDTEYRVLRPDGTVRWIVDRGRAAYDEQGRAINMAGVNVDITERKRAEEAMAAAKRSAEQAKLAAEAANETKTRFLANTSHELRTPMNSILGMTELALDEELTPTVRDYLQTAKTSADSLLAILNDILDFSRIESGKITLESIPFNLRAVLEETTKALSVRAHEKGLEIACAAFPSVPDRLVGDPLRLRQILTNLVGNAIKFTAEGEIQVNVDLDSQSAEDVVLRFVVADTGIGIPPEDHGRIFAPFMQADTSTTRHFGGSGLGLSIAANLIEMMGGRVWLHSKPGEGTTFYFTVRLQAADGTLPAGDLGSAGGALSPTPARRLRILLAEDTPANQKLVVRILEKRGHAVSLAGNGREAVAQFAEDQFDLVLMDVQMPIMDGFQATAAIRAMQALNAHTPIVAMTAHAMKGDQERCLAAGMDSYLAKPISARDLIELVERMAEAHP